MKKTAAVLILASMLSLTACMPTPEPTKEEKLQQLKEQKESKEKSTATKKDTEQAGEEVTVQTEVSERVEDYHSAMTTPENASAVALIPELRKALLAGEDVPEEHTHEIKEIIVSSYKDYYYESKHGKSDTERAVPGMHFIVMTGGMIMKFGPHMQSLLKEGETPYFADVGFEVDPNDVELNNDMTKATIDAEDIIITYDGEEISNASFEIPYEGKTTYFETLELVKKDGEWFVVHDLIDPFTGEFL